MARIEEPEIRPMIARACECIRFAHAHAGFKGEAQCKADARAEKSDMN
jgi:hypothetical protein